MSEAPRLVGSGVPPEADQAGWARTVALWLAWAKTALTVLGLLFLLSASGSQDPAGQGMAAGMIALALGYWLLLVLPALLLARRGKRIGLCLALLLLPELVFLGLSQVL